MDLLSRPLTFFAAWMLLAACSSPEGGGSSQTQDVTPREDAAVLDLGSGDLGRDPAGDLGVDRGATDPGATDPGGSERDGRSDPGGADAGDLDPGGGQASSWPRACATTLDCTLPCASGVCSGGACVFTPRPGSCVVDAEPGRVACAEAGTAAPGMACLICNPGVSGLGWSAALAAAGFEVGETDSLTSLDLSGGGVRWHPSERRSRSGARSLYAGDESSGTYAVDEAVETTAALGPIDLPTDTAPRITFSLWMETEETLGYDRLTVEVQTAGEGPPAAGEQAPLVLLDSDSFGSTTHGRWLPFALDLSAFTGQRVSITFRFATQDQKINGFEGVFLDDLRLWTGCCGGDADCDDGNPCTFGTCPSAGAACTIEPRDACCLLDADCDDGDPCTVDACPKTGGGCTHQVIEGCCQEAADCDDGDACTEDVCPEPGALCRHPSICCEADADCKGGDPCLVGRCTQDGCVFEDICCQGDEDCDDDDPCTFDICGSDGACRNKVKSAPGCCDPTPYSEGFDGSAGPSGGGYTFQSTSPPVGWQVVTGARFTSPTGSLYYGDPVAGDFDSGGVNSGTALGPVIELQEAMGHQLGFQLWFDGESGSSFDVLEVFVRTENDSGDIKDFRVWRKSSSDKKKTFHAVSANLSAFAGRSIQIVFRFDTKDGLTNKGEGVYVDDVAVTSTCAALLCLGEKDCEDGVEGTTGSCASGICTYALTGGADPGGGSSGGGGSETCSFSSDCDDGVSCTFDFCVSGTCESIDFCFF